jgi:hypothetical protein
MAEAFDGQAMLEVLQRHSVDFVVVGGFAAVVHGSPIPTRDVDVTPRRSTGNLASLSAALTELDARVRAEGAPEEGIPFANDASSLGAVETWNLMTRFGDLDITFTPSGTTGYDDLRREAVEVSLRGTPVLIASLADVVRSKSAANRDKDRRALPVLRELLARQRRDRPQS